jgi:hypothetical protein
MVTKTELVAVLSSKLPVDLATDLANEFLTIRADLSTSTLGRAAPGKFVETVVQVLQFLSEGKHERRPDVESFFRRLESGAVNLDEALRICVGRVARAMYSIRSKRGIAHKGEIDPNLYDLALIHAGAQWILSELVRLVIGGSVVAAGTLVANIQLPVSGIVDDFGGRRLVLADLTIREEMLVLLHSHYPEPVLRTNIPRSMARRNARSVERELRAAWKLKLVELSDDSTAQLTSRGFAAARAVIERSTSH